MIKPLPKLFQGRFPVTIGIGVLCSSLPKPHRPRPDALVMVADTMGSFDTDSTDELHKMWINDDLRIYAVGAGTLEYSGELFVIIENEIKALESKTHGRISGALNKAFQILRAQHFQWDVGWSKLSIPIIGQVADANKVWEEWQNFRIDVQMLLGTFDDTGQAYLYIIGQFEGESKVVFLSEFPGYATIGTGGPNAQFWLNYRHQFLSLSVKQSMYHAYEAKQMAAKAPTVNEAIEIVVALSGGESFHLTEERPEIDGCPFSLRELNSMIKKFGPKPTRLLGHPKEEKTFRGVKPVPKL